MLRAAGITKLDLLFVALILLCVAGIVLIAVNGSVGRQGPPKTVPLIKMLDEGCRRYKVEYGVYPPMETFDDSRCLHFYLGKPVSHGGRTGHPIVHFQPWMLDLPRGQSDVDPVAHPPVPVIDAWGRRIRYKPYPGTYNKTSVDIWSVGKDENDPQDDIANYAKEY